MADASPQRSMRWSSCFQARRVESHPTQKSLRSAVSTRFAIARAGVLVQCRRRFGALAATGQKYWSGPLVGRLAVEELGIETIV